MSPASTTFRYKGGGARISVNLSAETLAALEQITADGTPTRYAINKAIQDAAVEEAHKWVEVTRYGDQERRFICAHCDQEKTAPHEAAQEQTP